MEYTRYRQEHKPDLIAGSVLFFLFVALLLALILFSGWGFRSISHRMEQTYGERTVLSYVAGQIRRHDTAEAVSVEEYQGTSVLVLRENIQDEAYETLIYCLDGSVYELFIRAGEEAPLTSGTEVLKADEVAFSLDGKTIEVCIKSGGRECDMELTLRSRIQQYEQ